MPRTRAFCSSIPSNLRMIADCLRRIARNVCPDPSPLETAASNLRMRRSSGVDKWEYELVALRFFVKRPKGTLPSWVRDGLTIELDVAAGGRCEPEEWDPLEQLVVNIEITAKDREKTKSSKCAWHLDRNIERDEPNEIHPQYHFQHGGHRVGDLGDSIGLALLLEPPRVAHPPMEALLSIDFILANFAGSVWKEIRDDGTYAKRIAQAQELYWRPYFKSLNSWWDGTPRLSNHNAPAIWPNLI